MDAGVFNVCESGVLGLAVSSGGSPCVGCLPALSALTVGSGMSYLIKKSLKVVSSGEIGSGGPVPSGSERKVSGTRLRNAISARSDFGLGSALTHIVSKAGESHR